MKYANITFEGKEICNIGDQMQIIALKRLYSRLGINDEQIVEIPFSQLATFESNEMIVLPVSFPILKYSPNGISSLFNQCIKPIFIGFTWPSPTFSDDDVNYLKENQPIGCRDEYTKNNLLRYGIDAFVNGCITLTAFFGENIIQNRNTVYLVDVDEEFFPFIPDEIKNGARILSQYIKCEKKESNYEKSLKRYDEYNKNGKLIITSRLHCAIPCISMGIPTIILRKTVSYRFSWVEKLTNVFTLNDVGSIDWNPKPVDCSNIVNLQIENFYNLIIKQNKLFSDCLDRLLSNRRKSNYYVEGLDPAVDFLRQKDKSYSGTYILWGVTVSSKAIFDYISQKYPNLKLIKLIDKYSSVSFGDIDSEPHTNIDRGVFLSSIIFVTATAANQEAKEYLEGIGKIGDVIFCYPTFFKG